MIDKLAEKVTAVLGLLHEQKKVDGSNEGPPRRKTLLHQINELRRIRGDSRGEMYETNLSTWLNHPEQAPRNFLNELASATGLTDFGFDEQLWEEDTATILDTVRNALHSGALAMVTARPNSATLFRMSPTVAKGIGFPERQSTYSDLLPIREFRVQAGSRIATAVTLEDASYMRVVACEDAEFIGLNTFLDVPETLLDSGNHTFKPIETTHHVARTVVYAFASTEPCFGNWPISHQKSNRIKHGRFLQLLKAFYELPYGKRQSSVQSFVTTAAPMPAA